MTKNRWFTNIILKKISLGIILGGALEFTYYYLIDVKAVLVPL